MQSLMNCFGRLAIALALCLSTLGAHAQESETLIPAEEPVQAEALTDAAEPPSPLMSFATVSGHILVAEGTRGVNRRMNAPHYPMPVPPAPLSLRAKSMLASIGDGLSTIAVMAAHVGFEGNPLMPATIVGQALVTGFKGALLFAYEDDVEANRLFHRLSYAEYGGVTLNNLLVLAHAGPLAPLAGLAFGLYLWHSTKDEQ